VIRERHAQCLDSLVVTFAFEPTRAPKVRPSPVFLSIVGVTIVGGVFVWMADKDTVAARLAVFLLVFGGWMISLCLHEFAHAYLAYRFGDYEVEARGYLTLDPLKYSHPVLSILLPVVFIAIGGIGLPGGAVWVHPHRFRTDLQRALVSLSGPMVNLGFAIVLLTVVRVSYQSSLDHLFFWSALAFLGLMQIMATVLNLLPIPGFDGYGTIEPYLDPNTQRSLEQFKPYGMLVVFILLFQVQPIGHAFSDLTYGLFDLSGTPRVLASAGFELLKFWSH